MEDNTERLYMHKARSITQKAHGHFGTPLSSSMPTPLHASPGSHVVYCYFQGICHSGLDLNELTDTIYYVLKSFMLRNYKENFPSRIITRPSISIVQRVGMTSTCIRASQSAPVNCG